MTPHLISGPAQTPVTWRQKIERSFNILKYYRKAQIVSRLKKMAGRQMGLAPRGIVADELVEQRPLDPFCQLWSARRAVSWQCKTTLDEMRSGRITLLNETRELGQPIDWRGGRDVTHLWRFQLHYFEFLYPVCSGHPGNDAAWQAAGTIICDWIKNNKNTDPACRDDAWHPYCISRRLPVWFQLLSAERFEPKTRDAIVANCFSQATLLSKNLEWDLRGNHLLENLRCLTMCCCFFADTRADAWLTEVLPILRRELDEQILASGEHFERAPMYHCQVLCNLMEMAVVAKGVHNEIADLCQSYAEKMWRFLRQILHPDEEIPLFGDSCFQEVPSVELMARIENLLPPGSAAPPEGIAHMTDYRVFRTGDSALIFDHGPVGADQLPAHAHCDLLTLEASIGGNRWIVDSGNFDYSDSPMRHYCRSSAGHNVLTVAGQNQCDVWSKFRMGRRGRICHSRSGESGKFEWAEAAHDGYRHLGVPRVARLVAVAAEMDCWLCSDFATGDGRSELVGYLHLAPGITIEPFDDPSASESKFLLDDGTSRRVLSFFGASAVDVADSWYCTEFGLREKNRVFVYRQADTRLRPLGWLLQREPAVCRVSISETDATTVRCESPNQTFDWKFD